MEYEKLAPGPSMGRRILKVVWAGYNGLLEATSWIGTIALAGIVILVDGDIILRNFFGKSLGPLTFDGMLAMLIILAWAAAGWVVKEKGHVSIGLITDRLAPKARSQWLGVVYVFCALFCSAFVYMAWTLFARSLARHEISSSSPLPIYPLKFIILVSCCLLVTQFAVEAYKAFREASLHSGEAAAASGNTDAK